MNKLGAVLVALVLGFGLVGAPLVRADTDQSDEVTPAQDNPPGCVTATSEDTPQCGAQGRDHFASPLHRPPIQACADHTDATTGSRITRRLPAGPLRDDGSL